jgi:hypothetical protein
LCASSRKGGRVRASGAVIIGEHTVFADDHRDPEAVPEAVPKSLGVHVRLNFLTFNTAVCRRRIPTFLVKLAAAGPCQHNTQTSEQQHPAPAHSELTCCISASASPRCPITASVSCLSKIRNTYTPLLPPPSSAIPSRVFITVRDVSSLIWRWLPWHGYAGGQSVWKWESGYANAGSAGVYVRFRVIASLLAGNLYL